MSSAAKPPLGECPLTASHTRRTCDSGGSCWCIEHAEEVAAINAHPEVRKERSAAHYHPDPEINAEIEAQALEGELVDLAAGYAPKFWRCPDCGAGHSRGHFQTIGVHRCMGCGYVGTGGTMHTHVDGRQLA